MQNACPICRSELKVKSPTGRDATNYSCPQCGDFVLTETLVASFPATVAGNVDTSAKISHALRSMQQVNKGVELNWNTVQEILKRPLPSPSEQADLFIRWLAENVDGPGEVVLVGPATHSAIIGAKTPAGFVLVLKYLIEIELVSGDLKKPMGGPGIGHVTLTVKGWKYYESLRRGGSTYRKAFMAMKFGDPDLDRIFDEVFYNYVWQTGFELFRLTDKPRAGLIDNRMRVEIQTSDFLIADLTHDNLGAYWEAGYAEGLGKPVIYTCEKAKFELDKTHFDTNHHLTIVWDKEAPQAAGDELKATIRATLPELAKQQDE